MSYEINGYCMGCGECLNVCPVGAVESENGKYRINAERCVECGTCVDNCPMGVITQN